MKTNTMLAIWLIIIVIALFLLIYSTMDSSMKNGPFFIGIGLVIVDTAWILLANKKDIP